MTAIDALLTHGLEPLASAEHLEASAAALDAAEWGACGEALRALLRARNGFYAWGGALLVRPLLRADAPATVPRGLLEWNAFDAWKEAYDDELLSDVLFFAEDIFGVQFALAGDRIVSFDPESGEFVEMADSLEAWAAEIVADPALHTGAPLAEEWQSKNGALPMGARLLPKTPFVIGGDFAADNLYALDELQGMLVRADIAVQIRDVPDGEPIQLTVTR